MPKTSGAVLDWVPQKAAQQMQNDAMTRFMPSLNAKSRVAAPRCRAARPQRQVVCAYLRSIGAMQSSSGGPGRPAGDGPRAAHARLDGSGSMGDRPGRAVSRRSSLRCDQLFRWAGDLAHLRPGALRSPAHVPGAEQELLHLEIVGECGEIVPRLDEGVAEHGALHQPQAEWQSQLAAEPGWKLAVHDDDAPARAQLRPCVVQHREMVRHGVVAKAE